MTKPPTEKQALRDASHHLQELEALVPQLEVAVKKLETGGAGALSASDIESYLSKHATSATHYDGIRERMGKDRCRTCLQVFRRCD